MKSFKIDKDTTIDIDKKSDRNAFCPYCGNQAFISFEEIKKDVYINKCGGCKKDSVNYKDHQYPIIIEEPKK